MRALIGLDVGEVRVGVAIAPGDSAVAVPHGSYVREKGEAEDRILALVQEHSARIIVVGLPLNEDGSENEQCSKVQNFCRRLERRAQVTIEYVDEYLSTQEARERVPHSGRRGHSRESGVIDATAACIILQSFIDAREEE